MKINDLPTPTILVDQDILNHNINKYQTACNKYKKQLWPMIKTHKSTLIARMQIQAGATGFLCGTLDECEMLADAGIANIMYAYPVATQTSIDRVIELRKKCNIILRVDGLEAAKLLNDAAKNAEVVIDYTIIINSGLNRLGINPKQAAQFAKAMKAYKNLKLKGISTHPGHVYAETETSGVLKCTMQEIETLQIAADLLKADKFKVELITSGSTPTFREAVADSNIDIFHPGNYVYHDAVQVALGVATQSECALTVLASVISNPEPGIFIIDAGSKTLGLDKGAHGNTSIKGYGIIKQQTESEIISLSEEVGKISVSSNSELAVGDKIEIIPNHACVANNLTSWLITHQSGDVTGEIGIDMRGNSRQIESLEIGSAKMKLFIGLGNPGRKYRNTRHNVGFMVIDELAKKWGAPLSKEKKFKGEIGSVHVNGEKIILLKPATYMNLSGESVQAVMDFYDLHNEDIIVIYDDLAMELGKVRGREKGSAGGHNGIKSVILHLAAEEFKRFKIGIGNSPYAKTTNHVLGRFTVEEMDYIGPAILKVVRACEELLSTDFLKAVSGLND